MGLREIALARDTLPLTPSLATGMSVGANIAPPAPAVIRAIVIGTELPRGIDGARRPRVKTIIGGGAPGALGRASSPCSQASHKGLWIYPVKGLGSLARLRRGLAGLHGLWDAGL